MIKGLILMAGMFLIQTTYSQERNGLSATKIIYDYNYKIFENKEEYGSELMLLTVSGNRSSFMALSQFKLDSVFLISNSKYPTIAQETDWNIDMQKSHQPYRIYIEGSKLTYLRALNKNIFQDINTFQYDETLDFPWELTNDTKEYLGYKCVKAIMNYSGRQWIAWYSPAISINAGPYKFKNLPGIILELYDKDLDFVFKALSIELDSYDFYDPLKPYHPAVIEKVDKETFWQQLIAYDKLSMREQFNYGANQKVKIVSADDENIDRMVDKRPTETRCYIEQ